MLRSPCKSCLSASARPVLGFSRSLRAHAGALPRSACAGLLSKAGRTVGHPIKAMATLSAEDRPPLGPWEILNPSTYKAEKGSMKDKIVIVTGGNQGLGLETAKALAVAGAHVIVASRTQIKAEHAVDDIMKTVKEAGADGTATRMMLELASLAKVRRFADEFKSKYDRLDVLINNAGEYVPEDDTTEDGFEVTVGTNYFGHWYLTHLLLDPLKAAKPSRVVFVTSASETAPPAIDWDNLEGKGKRSDLQMYGTSKLYNVLAVKEIQNRIGSPQESGIDIVAAQPGISKSKIFDKSDSDPLGKPAAQVQKILGKGPFGAGGYGQSVERGAIPIIFAATSEEMSGKGGDVGHIVGPWYSNVGSFTPPGFAALAEVGNTEQRPAQNEAAWDDTSAPRLYDATKKMIDERTAKFEESGVQTAGYIS